MKRPIAMSPRNLITATAFTALASIVTCSAALAQEGQELFDSECASCHADAGTERAPGVMLLRQLTPRAIVASLEDG